MLATIFHGILIGLILAIMIGPIFLALMSVTLTQGSKKAYRFMSGNALSDMTIAILAYNGLVFWGGKHSIGGHIIGLVGACVFFGYGVYLFTKKESQKDIAIDTKTKLRHHTNTRLLIKGYIMNTLNPSIFIFRITILSQFIKRYHHPSHTTVKIFIATVLITFIVTDIVKINSAHWLLGKMTIKNLKTIHTVAGTLLAIAGVLIAVRSVF